MNFIFRIHVVKMYVVRARLHGEKRRSEIRLQFAGYVYTGPDSNPFTLNRATYVTDCSTVCP